MAQKVEELVMSVVHPVCCGIDIHKDVAVACVSYIDEDGNQKEKVQTFGTFTDDLYKLHNWLIKYDCPIVAIESTGVYWRPVHNVLENETELLLVNARHFKNVPGRKTDIEDSKWLCGLLKHGLLRGSYIPEQSVREWRELVRNRKIITNNISDYKRRVHKVFQTANIKIDSVVSDLFGVTGKNLMDYLCTTKQITYEGVAQCTRGSLSKKVEELYRSLQGFFTDHHRFEIECFLTIISVLTNQVKSISDRISKLMSSKSDVLDRLTEIPGVSKISSQALLGELGHDLKTFDTPAALASWAGVAPGNNESAGKRHSGKSPVRKHPLKEVLIEIAWAAIRKKKSYYREKYYRVKARRGAKRAIVAIAHRILKAVFHIIKYGDSYQELGDNYLSQKSASSNFKRLTKQAKNMGFDLVASE